jgi:CRISPR/Cas system endoribonuclease Cas6 (RAMP superfamily)
MRRRRGRVEEGIIIDEYDLQPHTVKFTTPWQPGFIGTCAYLLRRPDWEVPSTREAPLRQQRYLLARFAFYTGVGYKTVMGMGQARVNEEKRAQDRIVILPNELW